CLHPGNIAVQHEHDVRLRQQCVDAVPEVMGVIRGEVQVRRIDLDDGQAPGLGQVDELADALAVSTEVAGDDKRVVGTCQVLEYLTSGGLIEGNGVDRCPCRRVELDAIDVFGED